MSLKIIGPLLLFYILITSCSCEKRYQALPTFSYCKWWKAGEGLGTRLPKCSTWGYTCMSLTIPLIVVFILFHCDRTFRATSDFSALDWSCVFVNSAVRPQDFIPCLTTAPKRQRQQKWQIILKFSADYLTSSFCYTYTQSLVCEKRAWLSRLYAPYEACRLFKRILWCKTMITCYESGKLTHRGGLLFHTLGHSCRSCYSTRISFFANVVES